jgi:hypothetical protein
MCVGLVGTRLGGLTGAAGGGGGGAVFVDWNS